MINNALYSSNSDEWSTPNDFYEKLNSEFEFNLDVCATSNNHKCERYFTKEINGLDQNWGGVMFGAIHHIARLINGLRKHSMKAKVMEQ